ncbi:MAG: hypothetical protein UZ14_CFX002002143 [Chloroflexi bacterium OLB14]|nr:MAG: hypothetical protein UZ14_CFX002002143 [Chloroflexi bacterium OLB14]
MKRKSVILIATTVTLLLVLAFAGGSASALGCFTDTNGHWAEAFICWMYDNGLSSGYPGGIFLPNNAISRAEVAVLLQKMRTTGTFAISQGLGEWVINGTPTGESIIYYTNVLDLIAPATPGMYYFQSNLIIPSVLYSTNTVFTGAKICYSVIGGGVIKTLLLQHYDTYGIKINEVIDTTEYSTGGCTTINFSTPIEFSGGDHAVIAVGMETDNANEFISIRSLTAYLSADPDGDAPVLKEEHRESIPDSSGLGEK